MRETTQAYAIVRVDTYQPADVEWRNRITVKRILWDLDAAEAEVSRLNELNGAKGCIYFWQATRVDQAAASQSTPY
jgi:hypothetical protein